MSYYCVTDCREFVVIGEHKRESGEVPQKEYPARYHEKRIREILLDMGQETKAGNEGRDSSSQRSENAVEDMATPHRELGLVRHQKLGPPRTSMDTSSPLTLVGRERMKICSALL